MEFEGFLQEYTNHLDDPNWLSKAIVDLSAMLYSFSKKVHQAELDEARRVVSYLDQIRDGKKMAVSEAEKRALVDTGNARHLLENSIESAQSVINAIKKRLDVLAFDYRNQGKT